MGRTLEVFLQRWRARYFREHTEVLCNPSGSAELGRNSHFAVFRRECRLFSNILFINLHSLIFSVDQFGILSDGPGREAWEGGLGGSSTRISQSRWLKVNLYLHKCFLMKVSCRMHKLENAQHRYPLPSDFCSITSEMFLGKMHPTKPSVLPVTLLIKPFFPFLHRVLLHHKQGRQRL